MGFDGVMGQTHSSQKKALSGAPVTLREETSATYFPFALVFVLVLKYKVGVVPSVFRNMEMKALGVL